MDEVAEVAKPDGRRWVYACSAALLVSVLAITAGVVLLPVVRVVSGTATASPLQVVAYTAEVKAADEAAAAKKKAADDAAFLVSLQDAVKVDMQKFFDDPANGWADDSITVYGVTVISVGNNKYEGAADMKAGSGPRKQIAVHVISDGNNTQWSTDKGGLLPLFN